MKTVKQAKILYIICSVLLCMTGILLLINPRLSLNIVFIVTGALMLIFGLSKIVGYFSNDAYHLAFQFDLALGIFVTALGVVLIIHPDVLEAAISLLIGLYVIIDGVFKLQTSADAKRFGMQKWWLILLGGILCLGLGLVLVFRPFEAGMTLMRFIGLCLLIDGAQNLFNAFYTVRVIKLRRENSLSADDNDDYNCVDDGDGE